MECPSPAPRPSTPSTLCSTPSSGERGTVVAGPHDRCRHLSNPQSDRLPLCGHHHDHLIHLSTPAGSVSGVGTGSPGEADSGVTCARKPTGLPSTVLRGD